LTKGREYEVAFKIGAELEASFKKTLGLTEQNLAEINREVKKITGSKGFSDMEKDLRNVNRKFNELEDSARDFGGVMKNVAEHVGAFALLDKGAEAITGMIDAVGDYGMAMSQIQAATGLTAKDMEAISQTTKGLYTSGLGESYNDLADAVTLTRQITQTQGEELDNLTKKALIYKDVFGEDIGESIRSADVLMRQFNISADEAFNLMAQGNQRGLNKTNELLDTINEFSPQFKVLGYSAEEMFDFFATGLDAGAWNLDKVGDLVKEFDNRIKDAGDAAAQDALAQLFAPPDIDEFAKALKKGSQATKEYQEIVARTDKDTAATLVKNLQKGGKKGEDSMIALASILGDSQKILDGISSGSIRGADALQMVLGKLAEIDDPIEKQTMAIAIMGTQYEDLGQKVTGALANVNSEFDMTAQTMSEIEAVKYDNLQTEFKQLTRELMDEFILPLAEDIMPEIRNFVDFLSANKGLIKNLALIIPGAMAAKGVANGIKSMTNMSKAAMETATGMGNVGKATKAFGIASSLLGGPIGIGITAVSALTMGVMEYKRQQEKARDELLNMGEDVKVAYDNYQSVQEHTKQVSNLITEYDELKTVIGNSATPTDELEAARARLLEIEQQLIDLNPDILRAEDAKSGKFREQLGLVEEIEKTRNEMAKRDLEIMFFDSQSKVGELEDEYNKLLTSLGKYDQKYQDSLSTYQQYFQYYNEYQEILRDTTLSYEELNNKIDEFRRKIEGETGLSFENMDFVRINLEEAESDYKKYGELWKKTTEEIATADKSFQSIYDTAKAYIESNLGGTLEEQAAKFGEMSEAEQQAFIKALEDVAALNKELDLLPSEKKINVQVIYDEARGLQYAPSHIKNTAPDYRYFDQYADGGFASKPSIFGEAGLEAAVPIDNRPRSHAILDEVNRLMGHDVPTINTVYQPTPAIELMERMDQMTNYNSSENNINVEFSPQITIQGNADESVARQIEQAVAGERERFEAWFSEMMLREGRLAFK